MLECRYHGECERISIVTTGAHCAGCCFRVEGKTGIKYAVPGIPTAGDLDFVKKIEKLTGRILQRQKPGPKRKEK